MSLCTADFAAHQLWRPLLQALFMIARVLTTVSTTARRIVKGVFILTSLMYVYRPKFTLNARFKYRSRLFGKRRAFRPVPLLARWTQFPKVLSLP